MIRVKQTAFGVQKDNRYGKRKVLGCPFSVGLASDGRHIAWSVVVECDCGRVEVTTCQSIANNKANQCKTCQIREHRTTHGDSAREKKTQLYKKWCSMRGRCSNPNEKSFVDYGQRGISVCDEWKSDYAAFRKWALENGYERGLEIDRKDNNGNYEPGNCRWVPRLINARNKRNNRLITAFGETKSIAEWADDSRCVVSYTALYLRIHRRKIPPEIALTQESARCGSNASR